MAHVNRQTPSLTTARLRERGWRVPGTIFRRGSSYVLRIHVGGGRQRWITFPTLQEAEAAQRELASHTLAHAAGVGLYGHPRNRLAAFLSEWVARRSPELAPTTRRWYAAMARRLERDLLGAVPLARLTPRALEAYYARLQAEGASPTTALHHHRLLAAALRDAERQGVILRNPAALARAPRRARPALEIWSEGQLLLFLSEARASAQHPDLYLFLAGTGARLGEALGLGWEHVSLRDRTVRIERSLHEAKGGGAEFRPPKTPRGRRAVTLPQEVADALRALRDRQEEERRARGLCDLGTACRSRGCRKWHDFGLVFCGPTGKPLHGNLVRARDIYPLCKRLGLPWRRALHNLRHAHASLLLRYGVPLTVVQERLGHATAAFTLQTYAHVLEGMQREAAEAASRMLRGEQDIPK
jgi:integrase